MPHPENPKGKISEVRKETKDPRKEVMLSAGAQKELEKVGPVLVAARNERRNLLKSIENAPPEMDIRMANVEVSPDNPSKGKYRGSCSLEWESVVKAKDGTSEDSSATHTARINNPPMMRSKDGGYWILDRSDNLFKEIAFLNESGAKDWAVVAWKLEQKK